MDSIFNSDNRKKIFKRITGNEDSLLDCAEFNNIHGMFQTKIITLIVLHQDATKTVEVICNRDQTSEEFRRVAYQFCLEIIHQVVNTNSWLIPTSSRKLCGEVESPKWGDLDAKYPNILPSEYSTKYSNRYIWEFTYSDDYRQASQIFKVLQDVKFAEKERDHARQNLANVEAKVQKLRDFLNCLESDIPGNEGMLGVRVAVSQMMRNAEF